MSLSIRFTPPGLRGIEHRAIEACAFLVAVLALALSGAAQTVALNDAMIVRRNVQRIGMNIGSVNYYDSGQILKNLIGANNPGFEPLLAQQIWALAANGTKNTFTIPDQWDTVPADYWAGGTFKIVESQSGGAELGCTGTIAANTGPNYPTNSAKWVNPTVTVANPCSAAFSAGDQVIITKRFSPTPEAWWETGARGGMAGTVNGGAKLLSETADLCATCGTQALRMNADVAGSSAEATWYFDSASTDNIFVLLNGTYRLSFWAKAASRAPMLAATVARLSRGGINCGTFTPRLSAAWTHYSTVCNASESASTTGAAAVKIALNVSGGSVLVDNVSFTKADTDPGNATVLRDEVMRTLRQFYGPDIRSNRPTFRYWANQNAETLDNWILPQHVHWPTSGGTGYFINPGGAGSVDLSLEDFLVICAALDADPYLEIPVTFSAADAKNLVDFLAGESGSAYARKRIELGQSKPWTTVFPKIHLDFCNECWNTRSFAGQSLGYRSSAPKDEYYYDYSLRARDIFAGMRSSPSYSPTSLDLVMNAQTSVSWSMDSAIARAHPDSIEVESYMYGAVSHYGTDAALWQPAMVDPYMKVAHPSDAHNFYQSMHDYQSQSRCGAGGNSRCNVNVYEWGQGTLGGGIDQAHLDSINAGAGQGVATALQPLLNIQYFGLGPQALFALTEYKNGGTDGKMAKLWGSTVDMGGATNHVRPTFLGPQLVNQSIIGDMYSCPIRGNPTFNFAGSPNGIKPMPEMANVPYLYAFCFAEANRRSLVLINTDLSNSHAVTFAGTNPPQGTVTLRQYAPRGLNDLNEAPTGTLTTRAEATSSIKSSRADVSNGLVLPPHSVTAIDYTVGRAAK